MPTGGNAVALKHGEGIPPEWKRDKRQHGPDSDHQKIELRVKAVLDCYDRSADLRRHRGFEQRDLRRSAAKADNPTYTNAISNGASTSL